MITPLPLWTLLLLVLLFAVLVAVLFGGILAIFGEDENDDNERK